MSRRPPASEDDTCGAGPVRPGAADGNTLHDPIVDEETPGVPGFRTWRGVYWFVFGCFGLVVLLLSLFTRLLA